MGKELWIAANEVGKLSCVPAVLGGITGILLQPGPAMLVGDSWC